MAARPLGIRPFRGDLGAVGTRWWLLAIALGPVFIGALDLTAVSAVLPTVLVDARVELRTSLGEASWVVSGYLLAYALGMALAGRLADDVGRGRVLLGGLALFFVGSSWVATSPGFPADQAVALRRLLGLGSDRGLAILDALAAGRVVQGLAAGALVPATMALASDLFPAGQRSFALGVIAGVDLAGWTLGHVYGGLMVQRFPWEAIFWVNLPLTAIAMALVAWALPRRGRVGRPWSVAPDAALLALGLLALNAALAGNETPGSAGLLAQDRAPAYALPAAIVAVVCLALAAARALRSPMPLVPLRMLRRIDILGAAAAGILLGFCLMVGLVSVPLLVNAVGARSTEEGALVSGYLLAIYTVPLALAALVGGRIAQARDPRWMIALAFVVAAVGYALWSGASVGTAHASVAWVAGAGPIPLDPAIAGLIVAGVGLGLTVGPLASVVVDAAADDERGRAAALVLTLRLLGMMLAVSALTTYGLRRIAALGTEAFRGIAPDDAQGILLATEALISRVTSEMALIAVATCALGVPAALLAFRPTRRR